MRRERAGSAFRSGTMETDLCYGRGPDIPIPSYQTGLPSVLTPRQNPLPDRFACSCQEKREILCTKSNKKVFQIAPKSPRLTRYLRKGRIFKPLSDNSRKRAKYRKVGLSDWGRIGKRGILRGDQFRRNCLWRRVPQKGSLRREIGCGESGSLPDHDFPIGGCLKYSGPELRGFRIVYTCLTFHKTGHDRF